MTAIDDYAAHRATYEGVLKLFKVGVPVVVSITALVVFLITH